ncbi:amino acid permease [Streptomyces sp. MNP-20]|uniref:amino acid permease n=1 Tax=Streptomyces sp. MNP-20 TaxID=2721165 RepID=UPI001C1E3C85|nr:amino acid permease [Streptomyces sp. MNP-20]
MTAASIVTSLRGLPTMAEEELTMFFYIGFATLLFLIPAGLVSAELGGAFADRSGGVYTWVGEAFGQRWGFVAIWLQWIQNVVWYPTGLSFAGAALAYTVNDPSLGDNNVYIGLFVIAVYWLATLIALTGTSLLAKVTQYGFLLGTALPGAILVILFIWWWAAGHPLGWEHADNTAVSTGPAGHEHPRWAPYLVGLGSLSFLGTILLNFAGVESQAVHIKEMNNPKRDYPLAIMIAAGLAFAIFTLGALAVSAILPYKDMSPQNGVFLTLDRAFTTLMHVHWPVYILALLIGYGALGGALAWLAGPSKGLLATAHDGMLPPFMQRTNSRGVQRNILLIQGGIVTVIAAIYLVMKNVNTVFFLISSMTITLYIIMYALMYASAIKLRRTRPDLPRSFKIPGGTGGMRTFAGIGLLAVAFAFAVSFIPPDQLPIGSPTTYVLIVIGGTIVFTALPLLLYRMRKQSWRQTDEHRSLNDSGD